MSAKKLRLGFLGTRFEVSLIRTHLVTALELAVAFPTAFLAQAPLLSVLARLLPAWLTLSAAGFLSITLTALSLLTATLLTATLILFTIVCHNPSSHVRNVNCLNCRQV
jgi:hypothetical protein